MFQNKILTLQARNQQVWWEGDRNKKFAEGKFCFVSAYCAKLWYWRSGGRCEPPSGVRGEAPEADAYCSFWYKKNPILEYYLYSPLPKRLSVSSSEIEKFSLQKFDLKSSGKHKSPDIFSAHPSRIPFNFECISSESGLSSVET